MPAVAANMGSVAEFYRGKTVFITGGTGFMGKVLLEKLLRSCPGVTKLYVLLRPKGKFNVSERRDILLKMQIFDYLKQTDPAQLDKLVVIPGDVMQPGLGLSAADRATLQDQVSVIFHSAATVKFDEVLKVSVTMNVKGTQSLLQLAKQMRNLEAFIHVSTAYCNCDRAVIEEQIYPSPADPHKVMQMVDWLGDDVLADITPKLLGNRPNTYTYTKALAESLIASEKGDLPIAIVRPSIVTCAWKEPIPGWVDNFNGPTGMIAGAGKGLMRTMLCREEMVADVVPVDVPINLMITAAWHTAVHSPRDLLVYNCASGTVNPIRWREVQEWGLQELKINPMCNVLWYPGGSFTASPAAHKFWSVFCHFLPAYLIDGLISMCGHKPLLVRIHKRMWKAVQCLTYFTTNQWTFKSSNVFALLDQMSEHDRQEFHFDLRDLDWREYLSIYARGVRRFILKEQADMETSRRHLRRMYYVEKVSRLLMFLLTWRAVLHRSETARALWSSLLTLLRGLVPVLRAPLTS